MAPTEQQWGNAAEPAAPGEFSAVELVKGDLPADCMPTASDSGQEQPHGQRLPTWEVMATSSPRTSTPFKERELRPCQASARPSPHLPRAERPDPHVGSNLASSLIFWHCHFLDVTLGK